MLDDSLRYELGQHLPDYLERMGVPVQMRPDGRGTARNFPCVNPEHDDGDPSMGIHDREGFLKCHCFACGASYDLLDVIQIETGKDFAGALEHACDLYHLDKAQIKKAHPTTQDRPKTSDRQIIKFPDLSQEADKAHQALNSHPYRADYREGYYKEYRGLSDEIIDRYKLGFWERGMQDLLKDHPEIHSKQREKALILPFFDESGKVIYLGTRTPGRTKDDPENYSPDKSKPRYSNLPGIPVPIWNEHYFSQGKNLIAISEGIFDALSLEDAGIAAVALMGTDNVGKLLGLIERSGYKGHLLLALDHDKAGKEAQKELMQGLDVMGIPYREYDYGKSPYTDPNDVWKHDKEDMRKEVSKSMQKTQKDARIMEAQERAHYSLDHSAAGCLADYIERKKNQPHPIPTGFDLFDEILGGGLRPGLYVLGAMSSAGKTTFATQIGDNIASEGQDVLFITLEMDKQEIADKGVSRATVEYSQMKHHTIDYGLRTSDINHPKRLENFSLGQMDILEGALKLYEPIAKHFFIRERHGTFTIKDLKKAITDHIRVRGVRPVVIVDYLQIMDSPEPGLSDKTAADKNISQMRSLAKDLQVPIITLSSINRASYDKEMAMGAYKESGGIEFSADVALGMDNMYDKEKSRQKLQEGKGLKIRIKVMKNRNGRRGSFMLYYRPQFNSFYTTPKLLGKDKIEWD